MLRPEELTALRRDFAGWQTGTFRCKVSSYYLTLFRVSKSADFDYLYCRRRYNATGLERGCEFEYAGIYCKRDGLVYDGQYVIRELVDGYETRGAEALTATLKADVRRSVEETIANDRKNLSVTEIADKWILERLEQNIKNSAPSKARNEFLSGDYDDGEDFTRIFRCDYSPERWTEDSLPAYILDPEGYVAAEAAAHIESNQDDMLAEFLYTDAVMAAYKAILENPQTSVHRVKRIMAAVSATSAQTVTVTICKGGTAFTFKAEASQFRSDCSGTYSNWNIKAADRKEFERIFGRGSYTPDDITLIEYSRKVLYSADGGCN